MRLQTKLNEALEQVAPAERAEAPVRAYEGSLSKQKAKLMEAALQKRFAVFAARRARQVFGSPLGREVGKRILTAILSEKHLPAVENLTTDFPIVEPILAILTESVRKKAAASISEATDRIAEKAYREGGSAWNPTSPRQRGNGFGSYAKRTAGSRTSSRRGGKSWSRWFGES